MRIAGTLIWGGLCLAAGASAGVYQLDDGSGESSLGCSGCNIIWLNAFQSEDGSTDIVSIDIAFGGTDLLNSLDPPPNGTPIVIYWWSDPTDDGDPFDAVLEGSLAGAIQARGTDTFLNFALTTAFHVPAGEWFFLGFASHDFAVARDVSSDAGRSWIAIWDNGNPADPGNLASGATLATFAGVGFPGNALIRGNGVPAGAAPASTPEPAGFLLAGAGIAAIVSLRRRS